MGWKQERDSLIAQTLAFVQSVTGKKTPDGPLPPWEDTVRDAVADALPEQLAPAAIEPVRPPLPIRPVLAAAPPEPVKPTEPVKIIAPIEVAEPQPQNAPLHPRRIAPTGMQAEIRARIASFRAHQERFNREREEYFSATLTRLRASIKQPPVPRLEK
jgi:hypothetical protein